MSLVEVKLVNDLGTIHSLPIEGGDDVLETVKETVERFLQAEGQGSFVVETDRGWVCVPTRSIAYVTVTKDVTDA